MDVLLVLGWVRQAPPALVNAGAAGVDIVEGDGRPAGIIIPAMGDDLKLTGTAAKNQPRPGESPDGPVT
jgi:hypothetical protein